MPVLDETLTRKVANLARLDLTDQEVQLFTRQMGDVVQYIDQLQQLDVSGVEPLMHPLEAVSVELREDVVREFDSDAQGDPKVLSSAPEVSDNGFKVPPIL
jgi:aspartyl-tRNA(Asn)/glutamyl-tRNA(Gln) amidotransferase subunit C